MEVGSLQALWQGANQWLGPHAAVLALGGLLGASGAGLTARWASRERRRELQQTREALRSSQAKLAQARRNIQALNEELVGWRKLSAKRPVGAQLGQLRPQPDVPNEFRESLILGALLDEPVSAAAPRPRDSGFADSALRAI